MLSLHARFLLLLPILIHCISFAKPAPILPKTFLPVPIQIQKADYSCGPAAVLAVLKYWGLFSGKEQDLYAPLKTDPKEGTHPKDMLNFIRRYAEAKMEEGVTIQELREAIAKGYTIILDIQSYREDETIPWSETWEDGHYVVAVGADDHYVYAMDPSMDNSYGYVTHEELLERWHDYEIRTGEMWKNYQLAIFVTSKKGAKGPRYEVRPLE